MLDYSGYLFFPKLGVFFSFFFLFFFFFQHLRNWSMSSKLSNVWTQIVCSIPYIIILMSVGPVMIYLVLVLILVPCVSSLLSYFLTSPGQCFFSILLIYSNNRILVSLIFTIVFLFSVLSISALIKIVLPAIPNFDFF